jgi:hypothetical protein
MLTLLLSYWALTTILGIYWMVKNPSIQQDPNEFTLLEVVAHIFPCALLAWAIIPMMLLNKIKFKR